MQYLVRLVHVHETFRKPELEALAVLANVDLEFVYYSDNSPFCIIELQSDDAAKALISRSILSKAIYELWGSGKDYESLKENIENNPTIDPSKHRHESFRFEVDSFMVKHTALQRSDLIESFKYLPLKGPIRMKNPDLEMCIFEDYVHEASAPHMLHLGRWIANGSRDAVTQYDLKKRKYISRTSMDSQLSLVTANMVLAAPGKTVFDPFVGTGSFTVSCAHFGAVTIGSDIDGRSIRGTKDRNVVSNFQQYGTVSNLLDNFISDLTHTPLRVVRFLDGIVCDPPYGVREGPKVLGYRGEKEAKLVFVDGVPAHLRDGYIAPKQPYGFDDMMADVLDFSYSMLVDDGRLAMWMPTANDEDIELAIPSHPGLKMVSVSVQPFNKWARRLLTYRRLPDKEVQIDVTALKRERAVGKTASDLNSFRKKYFAGFKTPEEKAAAVATAATTS